MAGRLVLAPLLVLAALLAAAPAAGAAPCDFTLTDANGVSYFIDDAAQVTVTNRDAFETTGNLYFDYLYTSYYDNATDCSTEDGGREVVLPPKTYGGVEARSKIWVPQGSPAFVRQLWFLRNAGNAPASVPVYRYAQAEYATLAVVGTSNGDAVGTAADDWLTFTNSGDVTDPTVAYVWQGAAGRRVSADHVYDDCCSISDKFDPVDGGEVDINTRETLQLAPGETKILMHALAVRSTDAAAATIAEELAGAPGHLFAGMTADEVRAVQNFSTPDADGDGLQDGADNCPDDANAGQEDLDGDAGGDVCDADDDADGLPDDAETAFGTDPRRADTDGDARADRDDACPRTFGTEADGCPSTTVLVLPPPVTRIVGRVDPRATAATVTPARDRRLPYVLTARGSVLPPDGLSAQQACASPGNVRVRVRRGRRVIASRRARLRADCTFAVRVRFADRRRTGRGRRTLGVTVLWEGNRFLEPATIVAVTRTVG